jgi:signal peptidase I
MIYAQNLEKPLQYGYSDYDTEAPSDWIKNSQIMVNEDSVVIDVKNASLSSYAPTGSMIPTLDQGANGIRVIPTSPKQINVGDIVSFGDEKIVHRVVEKGEDEEGIYFVTKGDNNNVVDGKIRFSDIKYVTIGVLY